MGIPQSTIETGLNSIKDKSQDVADEAARLSTTLSGEMKVAEAQTEALEKQVTEAKVKLASEKAEAEKVLEDKKAEAAAVQATAAAEVAETKIKAQQTVASE